MKSYKGYTAHVVYDPDADILFGEVAGTRDVITFEAVSVTQLQEEFHRSVDDYLALCESRKETPERIYSGRVLLRIKPSLHQQLAREAAEAGISLNTLLAQRLDSPPSAPGAADTARLDWLENRWSGCEGGVDAADAVLGFTGWTDLREAIDQVQQKEKGA